MLINPFLHFAMAQLVYSRSLLSRHNSWPTGVGKHREQLECCVLTHQAPHSRGSILFMLETRKGHRTHPGHPQTNLRSGGRWTRDQPEASRKTVSRKQGSQAAELGGGLGWSWKSPQPENTLWITFCNSGALDRFRTKEGQEVIALKLCSVLFIWKHFPLTIWGEQWLSKLHK